MLIKLLRKECKIILEKNIELMLNEGGKFIESKQC